MAHPLSASQEESLRVQLDKLRENLQSTDAQQLRSHYYDQLVKADAALKQTIPYFIPPHKRPMIDSDGDVEFGAIPFWAKNPSQIPYAEDIPSVLLYGLKILDDLGVFPPPTITQSEYTALTNAVKGGYAVGNDGTLWGTMPYGQLNYRWIEAVLNVALVNYGYGKEDFVSTPSTAQLKGVDDDAIKIAIIGDWGTGEIDAQNVRDAAMNLNPDYLIHLGDVYYTGTPSSPDDLRPFFGMGNEMKHLVDLWPKNMNNGQSYTMNSNHEMYCGAIGLYDDALTAAPFKHQNGCTYFLIENDTYQIFGLDSAYNSPDWLYMDGALTPCQIDFVQNNLDISRTTIIMSHHTPFDLTGRKRVCKEVDGKPVSLWQQTLQATAPKIPDYWYFGHIHDGIVYKEPNSNNSKKSSLFEGCKPRCTGHASMPYGAPWGLTTSDAKAPFGPGDWIDTVEFAAGTPKDKSKPNGQVKNGFMLITLKPTGIVEEFYDEDGKRTWSSAP
jgi:hypothetical protein